MSYRKLNYLYINRGYRDDHNGRPYCFLYDNKIVLRTHPHYYWGKNHYGRVYNYEILRYGANVHISLFDTICSHVESHFDTLMENIIYKESEFTLCKNLYAKQISIKRYYRLMKRLSYESMNDNIYGMVRIDNICWMLYLKSNLIECKCLELPYDEKYEENASNMILDITNELKSQHGLNYSDIIKDDPLCDPIFNKSNEMVGVIISHTYHGIDIIYFDPSNSDTTHPNDSDLSDSDPEDS